VAAHVAVQVLQTVGVDAGVNGTKIVINTIGKPQRTLNVAEACAGLRSLMTFISVAATIAFLSPRPLWQKLVVVASAVPIAIICNMTRISGVAILDRVNSNWTEGFAHQFVGLVMLVPAACMMAIVLWALNRVFIEEADERTPATVTPGIVIKKPMAAIITKPVTAVAPRPAVGPVLVTEPVAAPVVARVAVAAPAVPVRSAAATASVPAAPTAATPKSANPAPAVAKVVAPSPAKPVAAVPPRPAGIVPPRPAVARPVTSPASAGTVPPRPVQPGAVPPRPVSPGRPLTPGPLTPGPLTPRPPAPRAIVPPRPPQPVVPPKPTQETP
jgi:exosortase/archaeosortase family protein